MSLCDLEGVTPTSSSLCFSIQQESQPVCHWRRNTIQPHGGAPFLREVFSVLRRPSVQVERFRSLETELRSTFLSRPNISLPVSPQAHEHSANSPAFMRQASLGGPGHSHGRQGTEPRGLGGVVTWLLSGLPPEGREPV